MGEAFDKLTQQLSTLSVQQAEMLSVLSQCLQAAVCQDLPGGLSVDGGTAADGGMAADSGAGWWPDRLCQKVGRAELCLCPSLGRHLGWGSAWRSGRACQL
jgi:hypothetical protein